MTDTNSGLWLDQNLTVNANTVYVNPVGGEQELVGKDVEITMPEIRNLTVDATAMGNLSVPVISQFENMEATIHHIGVDLGLAKMLAQETLELEVRWVEQIMKEDGSQTRIGCKVFLVGFPQVAVPEYTVKPGEPVDIEVPYTITGYKCVKDGKTLWDINRLVQKCIILEKDYFAEISSML
ncbi:MAG: phage major tail tube protein [Lachnospiraceae bacterium]|nr:phage major tail tube protein [Lachnospiraceae bacterium]